MALAPTTALAASKGDVVVRDVGASTTAPRWRISSGYETEADAAVSVSCPSSSVCIAAGELELQDLAVPALFRTTNGGATWEGSGTGSYDGISAGLDAVACPTASVCEAVGNQTWRTTDGGKQWTSESTPADYATAIACATAEHCQAVGDAPDSIAPAVFGTTDGGSTWTTETVPAGLSQLNAIACPSNLRCWAVGDGDEVIRTTDGGSTWTAETIPAGVVSLNAIACVRRTSVCQAVGNSRTAAVILGRPGGSKWRKETIPAGVSKLSGVACPSTSDCQAVGAGVALGTIDGGSSWTAEAAAGTAVSCGSTSACQVLEGGTGMPGTTEGGDGVLGTSDGGDAWASESLPLDADVNGIACPSPTMCQEVGLGVPFNSNMDPNFGEALATTNEGGTWTTETTSGGDALLGIACPTTSLCLATQDNHFFNLPDSVLSTSDGGTTWSSEILPTGFFTATAIACATLTSDCQLLGANQAGSPAPIALGTTNGGDTWTTETLPSGVSPLSSVSCPSASVCQAVGTGATGAEILGTTDGGSTWTAETPPSGVSALNGVDCSSTADCYAYDGTDSIVVTMDGGNTWTSETLPIAVNAIACSSTADCQAVGNGAAGTTNGGKTWKTEKLPGEEEGLSAVSCPSKLLCQAVGLTYS